MRRPLTTKFGQLGCCQVCSLHSLLSYLCFSFSDYIGKPKGNLFGSYELVLAQKVDKIEKRCRKSQSQQVTYILQKATFGHCKKS